MAKRDLSIVKMQKRVNRIGALVWKEFDFMSKDKVSIGVLFMLPVVIIWIAAVADIATVFEEDPQPIWIIDHDDSELSNNLIATFTVEQIDSLFGLDSRSLSFLILILSIIAIVIGVRKIRGHKRKRT